jgi:hypothetical protein
MFYYFYLILEMINNSLGICKSLLNILIKNISDKNLTIFKFMLLNLLNYDSK